MVGCWLSTLRLKKTLQGAAAPGKPVNYLFLGDLNNMGMEDLFREHNILPEIELKKIDVIAKKRKMRTLTKSRPHPWSNGSKSRYKPSYLDHVVAADHLQFKQFAGTDVRALGWPEETTPAAQDAWIKRFSDHGILYFEVQRP